MLLNRLNATSTADSLFIEFESEAKLLKAYAEIKELSGESGITLESDGDVQNRIDQVEAQHSEFLRSCEAARKVWDGDVGKDSFRAFAAVVQRDVTGRTLSERQLLSAFHLAASGSACNFSVPGAGKTTIVLSAYSYLRQLPADDPRHVHCLFVVGPIACFGPWESEFEICFGRKPRSVRLLSSLSPDAKLRVLLGIDPVTKDADLYLSHYQTLVNYEELIGRCLSRSDRRTMLVVDESHNIKGFEGVWSSAALRLSVLAKSRVALTGTPAPNGYEDLKNLFDFIHPGREVLGFSRAAMKAMTNNQLPANGLRDRAKVFFTRIRKIDLNIPEPTEKVVPITLSALQAKIYRRVEASVVPFVGGNQADQSPFRRALLIRLRQAASNPELLLAPIASELLVNDEGRVSDIGAEVLLSLSGEIDAFLASGTAPRIQELIKLCRERIEAGRKILIWTYFVGNIPLISNAIEKEFGCPVFSISGATPVESTDIVSEEAIELSREQTLIRFRTAALGAVLIATPQCLGEAISLHRECHTAIYFERDFNCGLFIQSKDRIHRFGLPENTVTEYFYLTGIDTVDEDIAFRLGVKEARMLRMLDTEDIPLFSGWSEREDADDIRQILQSYALRRLR
jgi:SNF2 family DNA or RNA helicase